MSQKVAAVVLIQNSSSERATIDTGKDDPWFPRMASHISTLRFETLNVHLRFYEQVFGLREYGRGDGLIHTQAAGRHDILTIAEDPSMAGAVGGVAHFGFRLVDPNDIDRAITEVERAGGRLLRRGEFAPGLPYAYVADPDGYEIEIWFE